MTAELTLPKSSSTDNGYDSLLHYVCMICNPDRSLCGTDLTDADWCDEDDGSCVVCDELCLVPCEGCGAL